MSSTAHKGDDANRRSTRIAIDVLIEVQGENLAYAGETISANLHGALSEFRLL